jgi:hypothetical protein
MRAQNNLAGVSFIHPPQYHRFGDKWREIITESGYFFTKDAMSFFSSRIVWDSLTGIESDTYGFITSEQSESEPRAYTVRLWTPETGVEKASEFQEFATLGRAKKYLSNAGFEHELRKYKERHPKFMSDLTNNN